MRLTPPPLPPLPHFPHLFQGNDDDLGTNDAAIELLAQLVQHSKEHPGATFNVGVVPPLGDVTQVPSVMLPHVDGAATFPAVRLPCRGIAPKPPAHCASSYVA